MVNQPERERALRRPAARFVRLAFILSKTENDVVNHSLPLASQSSMYCVAATPR
jgi:hypothetical protein